MLGDFQHQAVAAIVGLERVQDLGQVIRKLDVDHGAHHLANLARFRTRGRRRGGANRAPGPLIERRGLGPLGRLVGVCLGPRHGVDLSFHNSLSCP